jgi:hypothetical protein
MLTEFWLINVMEITGSSERGCCSCELTEVKFQSLCFFQTHWHTWILYYKSVFTFKHTQLCLKATNNPRKRLHAGENSSRRNAVILRQLLRPGCEACSNAAGVIYFNKEKQFERSLHEDTTRRRGWVRISDCLLKYGYEVHGEDLGSCILLLPNPSLNIHANLPTFPTSSKSRKKFRYRQ